MSGRLIILPKKSWHVGKRENIEKVLRDERIAGEEAAAAKERSREITQEDIVEKLKRSLGDEPQGLGESVSKASGRKRRRETGDEKGGMGQGWGASPEHVNLFGEEEREATKMLGKNADHEREKKEQELREQRRSGLAPTAFGEGAAEVMKTQPWYNVKPSSGGPGSEEAARAVRLGREVSGEEAKEVLDRDKERKVHHDPMGSLFRPHGLPDTMDRAVSQTPATVAAGGTPQKITSEVGDKDNTHSSTSGASTGQSGSEDERSRRKQVKERKRKKEKKKERTKKEKRKKREKGKEKKKKKEKVESAGRRRSSSSSSSLRHGDVIYDEGSTKSKARDDGEEETHNDQKRDLEELRGRRLAREGGERVREIRILAEQEMAGRPVPNERTIAYNNQYNASAARQNTKLYDGRVRRR